MTDLQTPMQQQNQQLTSQTASQVSDDGYWELVNGSWEPTELQNEAIAKGANPHVDNQGAYTTPQTPGQVVLYSSPSSGGASKSLIVIVVIAVGIILAVVLAGVLYAWASSLAKDNQDSNLVGDWTNPEDKIELQSNGDAKDSTGTFTSWYTVGEDLYLEDGEYYYKFRYSTVDEVLFLAPYNEDGTLSEEDCFAYLAGTSGESESYFNDRIEQVESDGQFPNWCNP